MREVLFEDGAEVSERLLRFGRETLEPRDAPLRILLRADERSRVSERVPVELQRKPPAIEVPPR